MSGPTPIYTALKTLMEVKGLRLHMPGHIGGKSIASPELQALAGLDYTEIPGLDDLHLPQGIIAGAQDLLARACGARQSFFLLNGATSGIHALIMSCGENERIMIPRNAHRSFYGGMVLSGAVPIYIPCELEPELGIAAAVRAEKIDDLLQIHNDVGAVFITSPSYYGTCCDIAAIAAVLQRWGKILMVDEAHGAHFPFHPLYPHPALQDGAAAVVNGLHKTWPVLTQGACLHLGASFTNKMSQGDSSTDSFWRDGPGRYNRLAAAYHLLTTTSPSYPLMACIDLARDFMEREGHSYLERALQLSREYKQRLEWIKGIRCYGDELTNLPGVKAVDPLKVLIGVQGLTLTGYQLGKMLREEYNIQVEMTEQNLILAMFSFLHEREDWERFYQAIENIAARYLAVGRLRGQVYKMPPWQMILNPRQAYFAAKRKVRLPDCRGQVAGEMVAAYPPGIPCLLPGEKITEEIWDYLNYLQKSGARIQGSEEADLEHIYIID
ncbi:MAG: aminotransferase class I/II-fold pyridoxal phosphate-dependent enzyme [Syntrophomonas sp.]